MKKIVLLLVCVMTLASCSESFNAARALNGGMMAAQAMSISDAQVQSYVHQYITQLDAQSKVCGPSDPYTVRLKRITSGLTSVEGVPLNFKVYKTNDVNAFACADGSVRVYTGLMYIMTDDELLGVIGHEIGHVAGKHSKKQMRQAILTAAAMEGVASASSTTAALADSQLGAIGQAVLGAKYSRKQETEADDFGYEFLKACGKNPWAMAMSFEKLQKVAGGNTQAASMVNNLFSSHPDTAERIKRMAARATAEGFKRPASK